MSEKNDTLVQVEHLKNNHQDACGQVNIGPASLCGGAAEQGNHAENDKQHCPKHSALASVLDLVLGMSHCIIDIVLLLKLHGHAMLKIFYRAFLGCFWIFFFFHLKLSIRCQGC